MTIEEKRTIADNIAFYLLPEIYTHEISFGGNADPESMVDLALAVAKKYIEKRDNEIR